MAQKSESKTATKSSGKKVGGTHKKMTLRVWYELNKKGAWSIKQRLEESV